MPSPTRGCVRRAVMALGVCGVLVAGLQVTTAVPARADCYYSGPGDFDYTCDVVGLVEGPGGGIGGDPGGGDVPDEEADPEDGGNAGGGNSGTEQVSNPYQATLPSDVVGKINAVLTGDCKSFLGTTYQPYISPTEVWAKVKITKSSTPSVFGPLVAAFAYPTGGGVNGELTVYPFFDSLKSDDIAKAIPPNTRLSRLPADVEIKALVILHEIGHLTGGLTHQADGAPLYNLLILEKCFGITKVN